MNTMKLKNRMMRSTLALAMTFGLVAGSMAVSQAAMFTDVNGYWAQNAIEQLSSRNILGGYPDGTFRPQGMITRAEFSAVLTKALNLPSEDGWGLPYTDVKSSHWAAPAIETVQNRGLVSGYPGGVFLPGRNISRAEVMAVLAKAANLPLPDPNTANQILNRFNDQSMIPTWARAAVAATVQAGIATNSPWAQQSIEPSRSATRGEVAAMVMNLSSASQGMANNPANNPSYNPNMPVNNSGNVLQGRVVSIPAMTEFTGAFSGSAISSEYAKMGDPITLTLSQGLSANGQMAVPAGSIVRGSITSLEPAGRLGKHAKMGITFTEMTTPNGQRIPIMARIATEDGTINGGTGKGRILGAAARTAIGAGLGAALGTAMGPLSGGGVGRGAIYGTAVGAGAGAVAAAADKGKDVVIQNGDQIQIRLSQPITLN